MWPNAGLEGKNSNTELQFAESSLPNKAEERMTTKLRDVVDL